MAETSIVVEVDEYGDYYEGAFGMGSIFYTCYEIEDKNKNKLVDFYQGSSRPLIGDEITIETDENDKYICFKEGTGNYKLVAQKNTKTNEWRIANFLDKKCKTPDVDMPYFKHSHWQSIMYRSNDSKLLCRSRNDCAVLLEENNQKIVFGWLNHGVEVFKKNKGFHYVKTNEKYNLDSYLEKEGFKNINDYVLSSPNIGGLGNQLFSYLSVLVYAKRNDKTLFRVESSYFDGFLDSPTKPTTDETLLKYKRAIIFICEVRGVVEVRSRNCSNVCKLHFIE